MFFQRPEENTLSMSASDISCFRSARFQLWHISHCASHTHVQWKISTVGWIGRMVATYALTRSRGALSAAFARYLAA